MITPEELRRLTDTLGGEVKQLMPLMEAKMVEAAKEGKREAYLYISKLWDAHPTYAHVTPTALQKRAITELLTYGYTARVTTHGNYYVPLGLQDIDGEGTEHVNHVICVSW